MKNSHTISPQTRNASSAWLFVLLLLAVVSSCKRTVLMVEGIPKNTPRDARLYLAGNFNHWDPADSRYAFERVNDSIWLVTLPAGIGEISYNITRGDNSSMEAQICGQPQPPRTIDLRADTIQLSVDSWADLEPVHCDRVTLVLDNLPEGTKKEDSIAVTGTFNNWDANSGYLFEETKEGNYAVTIPRPDTNSKHEYQLYTNGSLVNTPLDNRGNEGGRLNYRYGFDDTIALDKDIVLNQLNFNRDAFDTIPIVSFVVSVPASTPQDVEMYLAGSFTKGYPRDSEYRFNRRYDGKWQLDLPWQKEPMQYYITRGDGLRVEATQEGIRRKLRTFTFHPDSTEVYIKVVNWTEPVKRGKGKL